MTALLLKKIEMNRKNNEAFFRFSTRTASQGLSYCYESYQTLNETEREKFLQKNKGDNTHIESLFWCNNTYNKHRWLYSQPFSYWVRRVSYCSWWMYHRSLTYYDNSSVLELRNASLKKNFNEHHRISNINGFVFCQHQLWWKIIGSFVHGTALHIMPTSRADHLHGL